MNRNNLEEQFQRDIQNLVDKYREKGLPIKNIWVKYDNPFKIKNNIY